MILDPETGERFLIPVEEEPSGSAVAPPRAVGLRGEVVRDAGSAEPCAPAGACWSWPRPARPSTASTTLVAVSRPASVDRSSRTTPRRRSSPGSSGLARSRAAVPPASPRLAGRRFDDIVYFGADAERIEALQDLLGTARGASTSSSAARPSAGRSRSTSGASTTTCCAGSAPLARHRRRGYARGPGDGELRDGDRVAIVGAAGPMGFMHVDPRDHVGPGRVCASPPSTSTTPGSPTWPTSPRPLAAEAGVEATFVNSRDDPARAGRLQLRRRSWSRRPPSSSRRSRWPRRARGSTCSRGSPSARARRWTSTRSLGRGLYLFGTSGSEIRDMKAVLGRLEAGRLDTNVSRRRHLRHGGRRRRARRRGGPDVGRQDRRLPAAPRDGHGAPRASSGSGCPRWRRSCATGAGPARPRRRCSRRPARRRSRG